MNEPVVIGLEIIPLYKQVESSHSETQSCSEAAPNTMHHFLELTHQCEHGEHSFDHHGVPALTAGAPIRKPSLQECQEGLNAYRLFNDKERHVRGY